MSKIVVKSKYGILHVMDYPANGQCVCHGHLVADAGKINSEGRRWCWLSYASGNWLKRLKGKRLCKHCAADLRREIAPAQHILDLYADEDSQ